MVFSLLDTRLEEGLSKLKLLPIRFTNYIMANGVSPDFHS